MAAVDEYPLVAPDRRGTDSVKWGLARDGEIPMWVADMDFPVPPAVTEALRRRIEHPVFGYLKHPEELIDAFAQWQQRRHGWQIDPQHVETVPNTMGAIALAVQTWTRPGDGVLVTPPVYFPFYSVVQKLGRRLVRAPLAAQRGRYELDFDLIDDCAKDAKLMLLCSPHNPGGRVWQADELERLIQIAARRKLRIVSDEIHAELVFPDTTFTSLCCLPGTSEHVVIQAPSKTFNVPGLPVAFAVIQDAKVRSEFASARAARKLPEHNSLTVAAATAAYRDGDAWMDAVTSRIADNYAAVKRNLSDLDGVQVFAMEGTYLAWLDFSERWAGATASEAFGRHMRDAGLWLSHGELFGPEGATCMRLNFATDAAMLTEGCKRLTTGTRTFTP